MSDSKHVPTVPPFEWPPFIIAMIFIGVVTACLIWAI